MAIGINANNLQFYESGIIDAASCPPAGRGIQSINHAAIVVGWGEENGKKYWLVKNSYGEDFGENGYFRLEREHPNLDTLFGTCGLLFESVYPVVTEAGVELGEPELQCTRRGRCSKRIADGNEDDNSGATACAAAEADAAVGAALGRVIATASPLARRRRRCALMPTEGHVGTTDERRPRCSSRAVAVLVARRRGAGGTPYTLVARKRRALSPRHRHRAGHAHKRLLYFARKLGTHYLHLVNLSAKEPALAN